jgi:hypothetical protein
MFLDRSDTKVDPEYPEMTIFVAKKVTTPPRGENGECGIEYAYLQGAIGRCPTLGVKVNKIRSGDYFIVYKVNFASSHLCKKINISFTGPRDLVETAVIRRVEPSSIKSGFYSHL